MELAGLSHGHGARRNARDQRVRRSGHAGVPLHGGHSGPATKPVVILPADADRRQADYFLRLLIQSRRLIDHRIEEYRKATTVAEAKGDTDGARTFKRMTFTEQQDRQVVDGMIDSLSRRFPRQAPKDVAVTTAPSLAAR